MNQFIKDLDNDYDLDEYKIKRNIAIFKISSKLKEVECPYCGVTSMSVHSTYEREIQDLPVMGKNTVLLVKTRKMFCHNSACSKKTFSERHSFVTPNGKRTKRLEKNIIYAATNVSSVNASRVLKASNISASKSSICELLKKNAIHCG